MAMRLSKPLLFNATRTSLAANPYYHFPRNVTRTVMRENWKFTGMWLMNSQREQLEYKARNHSYGNFAIWWQNHFDAISQLTMGFATILFFIAAYSWPFLLALGIWNDNTRAVYQIAMSMFTKTGSPGAVWFEEEARQKKIGLFFE
ncbi:hypothetical protein DIPPA_02938 [Diplonema papillatum]|nr:hypothetical protein DIPPA_02938 [Diplonema papillatum]